MASFRCYDNSDVIKTLLMTNFHLFVSFLRFRKNLGNLPEFFGQMVYRPPGKKIARTPMLRGRGRLSPTPAPSVHLKIKIPVTVRRGISKRFHEKIGDCEQSTGYHFSPWVQICPINWTVVALGRRCWTRST